MIAERTLAQAAHLWGTQAVPFSDQPKAYLLSACACVLIGLFTPELPLTSA